MVDLARSLAGQSEPGGYDPAAGPFSWNPDAPPALPHACDSEFLSLTALPAKWSVFDEGGNFSVAPTCNETPLTMRSTWNAAGDTQRLAGITQPLPHAEWACATKLANLFGGNGSTVCDVSLIVGEANAPNAGFVSASIMFYSGKGMRANRWTDFKTIHLDADLYLLTNVIRPYVRFRCNGTALQIDTGPDGRSWPVTLVYTLPWMPGVFGLGMSMGGATGPSAIGLADFFRVASGAGASAYDALQLGRRVGLPIPP